MNNDELYRMAQRAAAGDRSAEAAFLAQMNVIARGAGRRALLDEQDAREVANRVLLKLWKSLPRLLEKYHPEQGSFERYLRAVCGYMARHHGSRLRARQDHKLLTEALRAAEGQLSHDIADDEESPEERRITRDLLEKIADEWALLDPVDQEILWLRRVEELPSIDVGARLAMKPNTVDVRCRRASEKLSVLVRERLGAHIAKLLAVSIGLLASILLSQQMWWT